MVRCVFDRNQYLKSTLLGITSLGDKILICFSISETKVRETNPTFPKSYNKPEILWCGLLSFLFKRHTKNDKISSKTECLDNKSRKRQIEALKY